MKKIIKLLPLTMLLMLSSCNQGWKKGNVAVFNGSYQSFYADVDYKIDNGVLYLKKYVAGNKVETYEYHNVSFYIYTGNYE